MRSLKIGPALLSLALLPSLLKAQDTELISPHSFQSGSPLSGTASIGYDSRYLSEGRDSLDGDSLISSSFELGYKNFTFGTWFGISPEQNYDELQLTVAYSNQIGDLDFYLSWTHFQILSFFPGNENDNEVGVGLSYGKLPLELNLALDAYYSLDAEGAFIEVSLERSFELTDKLSLGVAGTFGINQGYIPDGHDGANHIALSNSLDYAMNDSTTLSLHATYSWAIDRDSSLPDDELLIDFFHAGASIQFEF